MPGPGEVAHFGGIHLQVLPGAPFASGEISLIRITGKGPGNRMFTKDITSCPYGVLISELIPGRWEIHVEGINSKGASVASAHRNAYVYRNTTSVQSVTLFPASGPGSVRVSVSHPGGDTLGTVTAAVQQFPHDQFIHLEPSGCNEFSSLLFSGYYLLHAVLHDAGGREHWRGITPVRVIEDETSWIDLTFDQQNKGSFTNAALPYQAMYVGVSGIIPFIRSGDYMILEAHASQSPSGSTGYSYLWCFNGNPEIHTTGSRLSYRIPNTEGPVQLTVIVLASDHLGRIIQAGSADCSFTVIP